MDAAAAAAAAADKEKARKERLEAKKKEMIKEAVKEQAKLKKGKNANAAAAAEDGGDADGGAEEKGNEKDKEKKKKKKKDKDKEADDEEGEEKSEGPASKPPAETATTTELAKELAAMESKGRTVESIAMPEGITRRLNQLERDVLRSLTEGQSGTAQKAVIADFNSAASSAIKLMEMRKASFQAWKMSNKKFKGVSNEVDMLVLDQQMSTDADKRWGAVCMQFLVLKPTVLEALAKAERYINMGYVKLDEPNKSKLDPEPVLMTAARAGEAEVTAWLLQRGASPNVKNNEGETALHVALDALAAKAAGNDWSKMAVTGHYSVIWHLIERGADVEVMDKKGRSPLSIAEALNPPFELAYVANMITLAHSAAGLSLDELQPFAIGPKKTRPALMIPIPPEQLGDLTRKEAKMKKLRDAAQREEEERKAQEAEEAERKRKEEEAAEARKKLKEGKMKSVAVKSALSDLFSKASDEAMRKEAIKVLCDPDNFAVYINKLIDLNAVPAGQPEGLSFLRVAIKYQDINLLDALLAACADPNFQKPDDPEQGETVLHAAVRGTKDLNDNIPMGMCLALLAYGADKTIKSAAGLTPHEVAVSKEVGDWVEQQRTRDAAIHTDVLRSVTLKKILQRMEEEEKAAQQALADRTAFLKAQKQRERLAQEEARKAEEESARLLELAKAKKKAEEEEEAERTRRIKDLAGGAAVAADGAVAEALEQEAKNEEEKERLRLRADADAKAQMEAKLRAGQKPKILSEAQKAADREREQREQAEAKAQEEMQRKIREAKARKQAKETPEDKARRAKIEAEEATEARAPPGMNDLRASMLYDSGMFAEDGPNEEGLATLTPYLTEYTQRKVQEIVYDLKYWKNNLKGLTNQDILEDVSRRGSAWEQAQYLVKLINTMNVAHELRQPVLNEGRLSPAVVRELGRCIRVAGVNILIFDDLLRTRLADSSLDKEAIANGEEQDLIDIRRAFAERSAKREADEEAYYDKFINPSLSAELATALVDIARPFQQEIEESLKSLDEEQADELVLNPNLTNQLPTLHEFGALAYLKMQSFLTDKQLRDLREEKAAAEELGGPEAESAAAQRAALMVPLDHQNAMYTALMDRLNDAMKKRYEKLTPDQRIWWDRKRIRDEARFEEEVKKLMPDEKSGETAADKARKKAQALMDRIAVEHKDWERKPKTVQTFTVGPGEELDEIPTLDWLNDNVDLTGVDPDIVNFIKKNPRHMIRRYLAIKAAENEADASFIRRLLNQKVYTALTQSQREELAAHNTFLDRRHPMLMRLFEAFTKRDPSALMSSDLKTEASVTKRLFLDKRIHDAKVQARDWREFREQCAAEAFLDAFVGRDDFLPGERSTIPNTLLLQLHRNLHCQCNAGEDLVAHVADVVANGNVNRRNFIKCLHALQLCCRRDQHVFWDSRIMWTGGAYPFGAMNRFDAELVYSFNDSDVNGVFFDRFESNNVAALDRLAQDGSRLFSSDAFSRQALGLGPNAEDYLSMARKSKEEDAEIAAVLESDKSLVQTNMPYGIPVTRDAFYRRDLFIAPEDLRVDLVSKPLTNRQITDKGKVPDSDPEKDVGFYAMAEQEVRYPIGFGDLRRALVNVPATLDYYNPRGWVYE